MSAPFYLVSDDQPLCLPIEVVSVTPTEIRGRIRAFQSGDRCNQVKEIFGGAMSGARVYEAADDSGCADGDAKRLSAATEGPGVAMAGPHPVGHETAQANSDAASPQQVASGRSPC